jgi:hypothetical protein
MVRKSNSLENSCFAEGGMFENTDFITNQNDNTLSKRFRTLLASSQRFAALSGYFCVSGFHVIADAAQNVQEIRVLIGMAADPTVRFVMNEVTVGAERDRTARESVEEYGSAVRLELETAADDLVVDTGAREFFEGVSSGKVLVRVFPKRPLHAKLYVFTLNEGALDRGRVITGSSNLTASGLDSNIEFNVELKAGADYDYALAKFDELWDQSVNIPPEELGRIRLHTHLNESISPYDLYLKFLYEYFKGNLDVELSDAPAEYGESVKRLEYQIQAVRDAKFKVSQHGGVFLADVVGLGKTYMACMLARELGGRTLILAPPHMCDRNRKGSWPNVVRDVDIRADAWSTGLLEDIAKKDLGAYANVIVDEAHKFRNEDTATYDLLARICKGRKVILCTATPYNNRPTDILAQLKLFELGKSSTIPGVPDLDTFFGHMNHHLQELRKTSDPETVGKESAKIAAEMRDKVLKHVMVRRTRAEVERYFEADLENQHITFPKVADPVPLTYEFDQRLNSVFETTLTRIGQLKYARYTPKMYLRDKPDEFALQQQANLAGFMKVLLVKRLESSFYAFRNTLGRFVTTYEKTLSAMAKTGNVYVSKDYANKILDWIEEDDTEKIALLIQDRPDAVESYTLASFKPTFERDLRKDLGILKQMQEDWHAVKADPKVEELARTIRTNDHLRGKFIIFTESRETAEYLELQLQERLSGLVDPAAIVAYSSASGGPVSRRVIQSFDPDAMGDEELAAIRILISTEVLSEGVNLHATNVVINYDLPWNPTRVIQRVGRVNRVGTKFQTIYTYNFFPVAQQEAQMGLTAAITSKISAFIALLGNDSRLLSDGEPIESHSLFATLSKPAVDDEGPEDSELAYYDIIRGIRDRDSNLYDRIRALPRKARTTRVWKESKHQPDVLGFFKAGLVMKFYRCYGQETPEELDFVTVANVFRAKVDEPRAGGADSFDAAYFDRLQTAKHAFESTLRDMRALPPIRGNAKTVLAKVKLAQQEGKDKLVHDDTEFLSTVAVSIRTGALTEYRLARLVRRLASAEIPWQILGALRTELKDVTLTMGTGMAQVVPDVANVILSEVFKEAN